MLAAPDHVYVNQGMHNARRALALVGALGRDSVRAPQDAAELRGRLDVMAHELGAAPVSKTVKQLAGVVARMCDPRWWSRGMRRRAMREGEEHARHEGRVRRKREVYLSDFTLKRTIVRWKANRATLERLEAVNELGEAVNLADAQDASIANPANRRAELMTRCRGFEEVARLHGHQAVFLTLTTPGHMHRFRASGADNADAVTAREAHAYLCAQWRKIGAAWKRRGFRPYGFRVVEPHHDGTPHWHVLLFMPQEHVGWFDADRFISGRRDHGAGVVGIAGRYALENSPAERGAAKARYSVKLINDEQVKNPETGAIEFNAERTATGYIAKYIGKNIDGMRADGGAVGLDYASGKKADEASIRVRAWASVHGLRQFQQIGGPSVTVYRELRRIESAQLDLFEGPRAAADQGQYALFWLLQGGPEVKRTELSLRPLYVEEEGGKYGEPVKRVKGVLGIDAERRCELAQVTREHEWTVQVAGLAAVDAMQQEARDALARARAIEAFLSEAGQAGQALRHQVGWSFEKASGAADGPWTRVNNCTREEAENDHLKPDHLREQQPFGLGDMPWVPSGDVTRPADAVLAALRDGLKAAEADYRATNANWERGGGHQPRKTEPWQQRN